MKLRDLFDKLAPGQLDTEVSVKFLLPAKEQPAIVGAYQLNLEKVEIEDDGSITLVVKE